MSRPHASVAPDVPPFDVAHLRTEYQERRVGGQWVRTGKQLWTIDGSLVGKAEFLAAAKGHIPDADYAKLAAVDESLILAEREQ